MSELLVPIAISSQLDVTGEERIHAAPYQQVVRPAFVNTPWTPAQLTTGLWLKADAPSNKLIMNEDNHVSVWQDDSGLGRDVTLAAAFAPAGRGPSVGTYNGHRTVVGDGDPFDVGNPSTSYALASQDPGLLSMWNGMDNFWCIALARPSLTVPYSGRMISWEGDWFGSDFRFHPSGNTTPPDPLDEFYLYALGPVYNHGQSYTIGQGLHIWGTEFYATSPTSNDLITRVDGAALPSIDFPFSTTGGTVYSNVPGVVSHIDKVPESWLVTPTDFLIMGLYGQVWVGDMCEVIAGSTELTELERQKIEGYLAHKWTGPDSDLLALLPVDHPYKVNPPYV